MPNTIRILCPFYITHSTKATKRGNQKYTISCEEIKNNIGFNMINQLSFNRYEDQKSYIELFCSTYDFTECPYYKAIYEKYK